MPARSANNTTSGPPGRTILVGFAIAALILVPQGAAERETAEETAGIKYGYRMVDDAEGDGPSVGGENWLEGHSAYQPVQYGQRVDLALPFTGLWGCVSTAVWFYDNELRLDGCQSWLYAYNPVFEDAEVYVGYGLDSGALPATLIYSYSGYGNFLVAFGVEGTVEVQAQWGEADAVEWGYNGGSLTWSPGGWMSGHAVRFDAYGVAENDIGIVPEEVDVTIPGQSIPIASSGIHVPGIPSQELGPFGVGPIPLGTPETTIPRVCTPLSIVCAGPYTVEEQHVADTPPVGPYGPVDTPGVPGQTVEVPVALEVGFTDIRIHASRDIPAAEPWDGIHVDVPIPGMASFPVDVCRAGTCPLPPVPAHELSGSVYVRGTINGTPVDVEVPFSVGGEPDE